MKKKLLSTAIAAGMGMGLMSTAAQAVYVNAQGTGQALLYPYYSADNGNDTYVQVVNTSDVGKAVKVRFVESKNSQEVLDFNLYLSAHDVWTGAITATGNGGAKLVSSDNSCSTPRIPANGEAFRTHEFSTDADNTVERTLEGHVEIITMGDIDPNSDLHRAITHSGGQLPGEPGATCDNYVNQLAYNAESAGDLTSSPTGGLYGFAQLVNVETGTAAIMDATALADFTDINIWHEPGTTLPNLESGNTDAILFSEGGVLTLPAGPMSTGDGDPVSAVLMTRNIQNSYVVDPSINAGTDWVVTFPTKHLYVNQSPAAKPFTGVWDDKSDKGPGPRLGAACEEVTLTYWDRDEQRPSGGIDFSPQPEGGTNSLCYEANVITFSNSDVIGSPNSYNLDVIYNAGWMDIAFAGTNNYFNVVDDAGNDHALYGLPAIGYMINEYQNGTIGGVVRNYMGASKHKETSPVGEFVATP